MQKPRSLLCYRAEIVEFCRFLEPTDEETAERSAATERVRGVIQAIWPEAVVQIFGSFATGLYLPTSDMDLVVTDSGEFPPKLPQNSQQPTPHPSLLLGPLCHISGNSTALSLYLEV